MNRSLVSMSTEPSEPSSPSAPTPPERSWRPLLRLFAISFLLLFAELACIRWFGSTVILLTYFTSIVLMACVLGMSVGCLAASRGRDWINAALPLFLVATALAAGTLRAYARQELSVAAGSQESPQQIFFGAESVKAAPLG